MTVDIENNLRKANKAIKNAEAIQITSTKLLFNQKHESSLQTLQDLYKIMDRVAKDTEKSMKGIKLAESRARSRLMAVKKAATKTIQHTAKAKRAAIASKKAAHAALLTSKKMNSESHQSKKLQITFQTQINASIRAAKESEKQTQLALKSSRIARQAARIPLEPMKI